MLLRDDVYLIGCRNRDRRDLARQAVVTATSCAADMDVRQVISGQTRCVHGPRGAAFERSFPGIHRWMSDPADGFPAAVQLDWPQPISVNTIQLVFDTGLHRHLTLSHHDGYTARMCWGRSQPETVRDYSIDALSGTAWIRLVDVQENYQRLRRHRLSSPVTVQSLRITVRSTAGLDHARICEIRVEAPDAEPEFSGRHSA